MSPAPTLSGAGFDEAFPFAFGVDPTGHLDHVGPSLRRLLPELVPGVPLDAHLEVTRPVGLALHEVPVDARVPVFLRHRILDLTLRGQVVAGEGGGRVFLGAPWLTSLDALDELGLGMADFALHDPSVDALFLVQAQRRAAAETRDLAVRLREKSRETEHARQTAQAMLESVSHRFRTPLHALLGVLGQAKEARTVADLQAPLAVAQRHTRRLERLVSRVLTVVELQDRVEVAVEPVCPWGLVAEAARQATPDDAQDRLHLPAPPRDAPAALLDPRLTRLAVGQLVDNAIQHAPGASVLVEVHLVEDGRWLAIEVVDDGPGLPEDVRVRDFAPFLGAATEADGGPGAGLGLAMVKAAAERMGGRAELCCPPEGGTRALLRLPTRQVEPTAVPEAPVAPAVQRRLRVLVVDDAADNRRLAAWVLADAGHQVGEAADGAEAIEQAARQGWDVVVMDLEMPGVDGITATRRILGTDGAPPVRVPVPVVVPFTAHDLSVHRSRCAAAGMTGFLVKPAPAARIRQVVEAAGQAVLPADPGPRPAPPGPGLPAWLMSAFAEDLEETAAELERADTVAELRALTHRLAGSSGSYGYGDLCVAARALNHSVKAGGDWEPERDRLVAQARAVAAGIPRSGEARARG